MGLAVAGARTAFTAFPRFLLLRACFLFSSSGAAPSGPALRPHLRTIPPSGETRALPRVLTCCPLLGGCRRLPPVSRPSALPLQPCFGTPIRHPEPACPICLPPLPERASARRNWFHHILSSLTRLVKFCPIIRALRHFFRASFPSRQGRCCASVVSRTSRKTRSYPQAARLLVDNSASCGNASNFDSGGI